MILLIFCGVIILALAVWMTTYRVFAPVTGQLYVEKHFFKNVAVIGDIPEIEIPRTKLHEDLHDKITAIRIDSNDLAAEEMVFPKGIASFDYRYKKYRPLREVRETGGKPVWKPEVPEKDKTKPEDPDTVVLGEWKVRGQISLFAREREDIYIKIRSEDGIEAFVKGTINFLVWNMDWAISAVKNFKQDPENAIKDKFQKWAKKKKYFKDINGASFEDIDGAEMFFKNLNRDIYTSGVIVEDIELTEFIILLTSLDIAQAQELEITNTFKRNAEQIETERKKIEGEGNKAKKLLENTAEEDLQDKLAKVAVTKDKGIKENETAQYKEKIAAVAKNSVLLIKEAGKFKKIPDVTEITKIQKLPRQLRYLSMNENGGSGGSNLDDKLVQGVFAGTALALEDSTSTKTKKGGS